MNHNLECRGRFIRVQFHQLSTYSFYARRYRMRKKRQSSQHCHFTLLGSSSVKVVRRTLMKSTPDFLYFRKVRTHDLSSMSQVKLPTKPNWRPLTLCMSLKGDLIMFRNQITYFVICYFRHTQQTDHRSKMNIKLSIWSANPKIMCIWLVPCFF